MVLPESNHLDEKSGERDASSNSFTNGKSALQHHDGEDIVDR
jgi:hypothetical protein